MSWCEIYLLKNVKDTLNFALRLRKCKSVIMHMRSGKAFQFKIPA